MPQKTVIKREKMKISGSNVESDRVAERVLDGNGKVDVDKDGAPPYSQPMGEGTRCGRDTNRKLMQP